MKRDLDQICVDTIRFLAVDMVQEASSGHPGLPLDAAPMAYVLWTRLLRHSPSNPHWWDRDRFVLSAGHGSALPYALLHLTGYDLPLDQIEQIERFRQWGGTTPGHPESHLTPGVEASTGPLGQGVGNALGMAIERALRAAKRVADKPSLIVVQTVLGYGAPDKQGTYEAHGSPLGPDEVTETKRNLGWPTEPPFHIPSDALAYLRGAVARGRQLEQSWRQRFDAYARDFPELAREVERRFAPRLPESWADALPVSEADGKGMATRKASEAVLQELARTVPEVVGGSGDLDPSTYTWLKQDGDFESPRRSPDGVQGIVGGGWSYAGRNIHFGVREHAMAAAVNGLAYHGGFIPFAATFLVFSDYMRPAIRLAALAKLPSIFNRFGASAPGEIVLHELGFTVDAVVQRALALVR